jgi:2-methylcitrate dehydratase PrpD
LEDRLTEILRWLWRTEPPGEIDAKARLVVLDTVGCVLAAAREPKARKLAARLAAADPGQVRVPGFGESLSAGSAAALFAAAACWHEACEGLARAHGRPGVPVIAACLALAPGRGSTLGETLRAVVAGYETGGRLGEALRIAPGMHVDGTWPAFGVAAAAVRIAGGTAEDALSAVRAAACQLPYSLYLPVKTGAEVRNTYLAHAAQLGALSAAAALAGMTSPAGGLDELVSLYSGKDSNPIVPRLAAAGEWLLEECYLKPFAAVRHVHYGAAAALALRPRLAGRLERVTRIELSTYAEALTYCGNRAPRTPLQAQFSLSFGAACALATGELVPDSYAPDVLENSSLRQLEAKIVLSEDEALGKAGKRGARLTIELDREKLQHAVDRVAGDPSEPMPREAAVAKFARYSGRPAEEARRFLDASSGKIFSALLEKLTPA